MQPMDYEQDDVQRGLLFDSQSDHETLRRAPDSPRLLMSEGDDEVISGGTTPSTPAKRLASSAAPRERSQLGDFVEVRFVDDN